MRTLVAFLVINGIVSGSTCPTHRCPQFWLYFKGNCYRYFGDRVPWETALQTCQSYYSANGRGDLVSIKSVDENAFVYDLFRMSAGDTPRYTAGPPFYGTWIGLHQVNAAAAFNWTDGSTVGYSNWRSGEPNNYQGYGGDEDCGHLWRRGPSSDNTKTWNDLACHHDLAFVCKVAPTQR